MRSTKSQAGIGHIVVVMVLLLVGVVGFAGYKVLTKNANTDSTASSVNATPPVPDKISTKADLETTGKTLDNSSSQLDSGLNDGALDADMNDML